MSEQSFPLSPSERSKTEIEKWQRVAGQGIEIEVKLRVEIEQLKGALRAAKVALDLLDKWMTPNVGGWQLESDRKELDYIKTRIGEIKL